MSFLICGLKAFLIRRDCSRWTKNVTFDAGEFETKVSHGRVEEFRTKVLHWREGFETKVSQRTGRGDLKQKVSVFLCRSNQTQILPRSLRMHIGITHGRIQYSECWNHTWLVPVHFIWANGVAIMSRSNPEARHMLLWLGGGGQAKSHADQPSHHAVFSVWEGSTHLPPMRYVRFKCPSHSND